MYHLSMLYIACNLSTPANSTNSVINTNHFSTLYDKNDKLKIPLGLRLLK